MALVTKEIDIQHAFMQWVELMSLRDRRYKTIFPVCNNARGGTVMMGVLKKLGMRKGVHDVIGLLPNKAYHGLTIEFKSAEGATTPDQKIFAYLLRDMGYLPHLCRSMEEAQSRVLDYISHCEVR